jgi:hypothetical protein
MIVSNPPYIDAADPHLAEGDVRFEPLTALVAADQGLPIWRRLSARDGSICCPAAGCCWSMAGPRAKRCAPVPRSGLSGRRDLSRLWRQ